MRILLFVFLSLFLHVFGEQINSSLTDQLEGKRETYYSILGVGIDADQAQIKANYRKLARLHHPDRASAQEKLDKQQLFVKLSEAYQILSDDVLRARYEFLLSEGINTYENRDWSAFDKKRGLNRQFSVRVDADGKEQFVFKDVYQQYQEVAEERALLISFGISGLVALIPIILYHYRKRETKQIQQQEIKQEKDQFVLEHERKMKAFKAQREEEERQAQEMKEAQRQLNQQRKELLRKLEDEEKMKSGKSQGPDVTSQDDASEEEGEEKEAVEEEEEEAYERRGKAKKSAGEVSVYKCDVCRKSYKSEKQYEQHCMSKDHIKKVKSGGGRK